MRHAWFGLLLLLGTPLQAAQPPALLVMTDIWLPFRMQEGDGALSGLDIDLLDQLSQRTVLRFEVQRAPWARGLAAFQPEARTDLYIGFSRQRGLQTQYQQVTQALAQMQAEGWIVKAAQRYQSAAP